MKKFWKEIRGKRAVLASLALALLVCVWATALDLKEPTAVAASAEITNWGLSFQREGEPPVGNADSAFLAQYNALYRVDTEEKVLYLTFDAG